MKNRFVYSLFLVCVLFLFSSYISGQCSRMDTLKADYKQEHYISLEFIQIIHSDIFSTVDTLTGTVWAGWQGRFRLEMPNQQLVSNGDVYWSYSVDNEQVIVESVENIGGWNPLTLLYDPEGVYSCIEEIESDDGNYRFLMQALDSNTVPYQFFMTAEKDTYNPSGIEYFDDNESKIEIFISEFLRLQEVVESKFEFVAPEGVEVIEMP